VFTWLFSESFCAKPKYVIDTQTAIFQVSVLDQLVNPPVDGRLIDPDLGDASAAEWTTANFHNFKTHRILLKLKKLIHTQYAHRFREARPSSRNVPANTTTDASRPTTLRNLSTGWLTIAAESHCRSIA
jgi:hypothetical protein